jgi:hypothetical protein
MNDPVNTPQPSPGRDSELSPAEALRDRLTQGGARFWVLVATTLVWMIDVTLFRRAWRKVAVRSELNLGPLA